MTHFRVAGVRLSEGNETAKFFYPRCRIMRPRFERCTFHIQGVPLAANFITWEACVSLDIACELCAQGYDNRNAAYVGDVVVVGLLFDYEFLYHRFKQR
jgi:hypothetical protein